MILLSTDVAREIRDTLRDAIREFEALEESYDWYTAGTRLMAKLEKAEAEMTKAVPK